MATAAGATWGSLTSWSSGLPNQADATANFNSGSSLQHTVTVDGARTIGAIVFNDPTAYTLSGSGSITLNSTTGSASITVLNGSHAITAGVSLNQNTNITTAAGSVLTLTNLADSTVTITKQGAGAFSVNRIRAATLSINAGTVSILGPRSASAPSQISTLTIAGGAVPTSTLDLGANDLIVNYTNTSPLATIAAQIKSAYATGSWTGFGITSSAAVTGPHPTGLGYAGWRILERWRRQLRRRRQRAGFQSYRDQLRKRVA
jgi:hypothetical protein